MSLKIDRKTKNEWADLESAAKIVYVHGHTQTKYSNCSVGIEILAEFSASASIAF